MKLVRCLSKFWGALCFGLVVSYVLATLINSYWPDTRKVAFWILFGFWMTGLVQVVAREISSEDEGKFEDPSRWVPAELPQEFRFIKRGTTLEEVVGKLGPYSGSAGDAIRYDLPSRGTIFIRLNALVQTGGVVRALQFYDSDELVPVFPPFGN